MSPILVNLMPPNAGGGLQNALSFVIGLAQDPTIRDIVVVACPRGGPIHRACTENGVQVETFNRGFHGRIFFELIGGYLIARRHRANSVFTLFGNAPLFSPRIYKISGFALSNVLMPEIDFWQDLPRTSRIAMRLKDRFRGWAARRSHEIIVETDFLAVRARRGFFKDRIVHVVKMEPSIAVVEALSDSTPTMRSDRLRLLALSGPHPNKRLVGMGPIMARLEEILRVAGDRPPELMISFENSHPHATAISDAFEAAGAQQPRFIGRIAPNEVAGILRQADGLVNISRLESFSNNWVEAWAAGIPLISTDADWARSSCGDAAIYINPDDPSAAARRIANFFSNPECIGLLRDAGLRKLSELAANGTKNNQYYKIIREAENQRRKAVG